MAALVPARRFTLADADPADPDANTTILEDGTPVLVTAAGAGKTPSARRGYAALAAAALDRQAPLPVLASLFVAAQRLAKVTEVAVQLNRGLAAIVAALGKVPALNPAGTVPAPAEPAPNDIAAAPAPNPPPESL